MVIKLVQTDSVDPYKITLTVGEHSFGRGKLLGCDDKRISRNHGQLDVYDDHIQVKALHQNPCFYIKKGTKDKQILKKDSVISLNNGDRFGLLPDAFWYEVLHCTLLNKSPEKNEREDSNTEEYCPEPNTKGNENSDLDDTINDNTKAESPTIISPINENTSDNVNSSITPQNRDSNKDYELGNKIQKSNHNEQENKEADKITVKRSHSTDQVDESKKIKTDSVEVKTDSVEVKTEPAEVKTEPADVKTEPVVVKTESEDVIPGPSLDQPVQNNSATVNDNAPSTVNPNKPLRERCMYGANCYRRNRVHFSQFSHPSDPDWGDGPRAPCPDGGACVRSDPRHHRDHYHPPGHVPPPPRGKIRKRRGSSFSPPPGLIARARKKDRFWRYESEDEESNSSEDSAEKYRGQRGKRGDSYSPPPGLIVQGKRARKTLQMPNPGSSPGSSDEEEKDPYGTDESDEWRPQPGESQDFSEDFL